MSGPEDVFALLMADSRVWAEIPQQVRAEPERELPLAVELWLATGLEVDQLSFCQMVAFTAHGLVDRQVAHLEQWATANGRPDLLAPTVDLPTTEVAP